MVRLKKEACAATVAAEDQGRRRPLLVRTQVELQQGVEVLVGRVGVTDMKLHRLTDAHSFTDGESPAVADETEDVADQEIAALQIAAVLVDDPADAHPLLEAFLVVRTGRRPEFLQVLKRRTPP